MPITPFQLDVIQELVNIGVGHAAGLLNQMTHANIRLSIPEVRVLDMPQLPEALHLSQGSRISAVKLPFEGAFSGTAVLAFPSASAASLVSILIGSGGRDMDMDSLRVGTLQEIGNIVLSGVMGSFANVLRAEQVRYLPLDYFEDHGANLVAALGAGRATVLYVRAHFAIEDRKIGGDIVILFRLGSFHTLLAAIDRLRENISPSGDE